MITFVAANETMGDGKNLDTMDFFMNQKFPWLSLAVPKLREAGFAVKVANWQDQNIHWPDEKFIIIGPIWDYVNHPQKFETWLSVLQESKNIVHNSVEFLRWNMQKTYLLDLQTEGIGIPPTFVIDSNAQQTLRDVVASSKKQWGTDDIIIKGVVDGGAFGYRHVKPGTADHYEEHFSDLKTKNAGAMVQPFLPEISRTGEYSFVFFDQGLSHGFLKVATQNEERIQRIYHGRGFHFKNDTIADQQGLSLFRPDLDTPSETEIQSAKKQAIEIRKKLSVFLQKRNIIEPLYLRVDGAMSHGKFLVMELEGIEPYMEFAGAHMTHKNTQAMNNYVEAISAAYQKALYKS